MSWRVLKIFDATQTWPCSHVYARTHPTGRAALSCGLRHVESQLPELDGPREGEEQEHLVSIVVSDGRCEMARTIEVHYCVPTDTWLVGTVRA